MQHDHARLLYYLDGRGEERRVKSPSDWQRRRKQILAGMQAVMGPLPGLEKKVPLDVRVAEEVRTDRFIRRKLYADLHARGEPTEPLSELEVRPVFLQP